MISLMRVATIAANTVREAVRNKLLYVLLVFAILLITFSVLVSTLSYVESDRILQDIGIGAIRLFSVAIAIFVGVGLIHKEVDRRTIYTILSKPLSRAEFLLGKYVGLVVAIWLQMAVMIGFFVLIAAATGIELWAGHAAMFALTAVELALVVAVATFFSAFTTPMLASFFSTGIWAVGHMSRDLRDLGAQSPLASVREMTALLYRVLPDLESFNLSIEAVHGLPFETAELWLATVYGAAYATIVLLLAVVVFERRDFR